MNNPASSGGPIVALALTPPYIPSQTYPIIHPVAQVGLSRLNYYADSKGLLVLFGPYQGQVRNETGRIYLNGLPVPTPAKTTVDTTSPLEFLVPLGLLSDGINNLKVSLQRQSGNEDSSELSVLHSLVDPAGNDTDPNPGNSLLNIDVTPKSIGPAEAIAGVKLTMSYPGMALYDLLTINYGGKTLTHQLVPTAQDPNPETKPVVLTFNTADFAHDPNNPQFIFKYNVISQIDDFSGTSSNGVFNPQEFWSKDCVVNVHLDWVELLEAILQEILGDNNDDPAIVDLGKMNGGPLWALIHLVNTIWQAGDQIHLTFEAWLNGVMVATHDETLPIGNVPGQFSWPIPNLNVVANSQVKVRFEQIRAGKVIGISKTAEAQVVGEPKRPLSIDTSDMRLDGAMVLPSGYLTAQNGLDAPGNSQIREATGGEKPYTYVSKSSLIASVDSDGKVSGLSTGSTEIVVTDNSGAQASFRLHVTNIFKVTLSGGHPQAGPNFNYATYMLSLSLFGESNLTPQLLSVIQRCYTPPYFNATAEGTPVWTGHTGGGVYNFQTKSLQSIDPNTVLTYGYRFQPV